MKKRPTLLILGYKRSGKDTAAEYWRDNYGLTFQSSSRAAAEIFIFDELKTKYNYNTIDECFEDRVNHRPEWFNMIADYNTPDETRLAVDIVERTGCYVGMRRLEEVTACKLAKNKKGGQLFDLIIWIDADERIGTEDKDSCTVTKECADIIIDNNGTEEEFQIKLNNLGKILFN